MNIKFANEHLNDPKKDWECCGQMRIKLSSFALTQLEVFGGRKMLTDLRTPSLQSSTGVETLCFWGCFSDTGTSTFAALSGQCTEPLYCKILDENRFSLFQHGNRPNHTAKKWFKKHIIRSWSDLADLQTLIL